MIRSSYTVIKCGQIVSPGPERERKKAVWIVDNDGPKSVTNDAEQVCLELHKKYPDHRIIYRDTDNHWDELVHRDGFFNHYADARHLGIEL